MGVTVQHDVNPGVYARPHLVKVRAGLGLFVTGAVSVWRSLVDGGNDQVGLWGQLSDGLVHGLHRVADGEAGDSCGGDNR